MSKKIAVIGSGIAGLCVAERLLFEGYKVTMLHGAPGNSMASQAAIGVFCLKGNLFAKSQAYRQELLGFWALKKSLAKAQLGVYELAANKNELNELLARIYHRKFRGLFLLELKRAQDLPLPFPDKLAALFFPQDFSLDLKNYLDEKRARILPLCAANVYANVEEISEASPGIRLKTGEESYDFDEVVLCAGQGSIALLHKFCQDPPVLIGKEAVSLRITHPSFSSPFALKRGRESFRLGEGTLTVGPLPSSFEVKDSAKWLVEKWQMALPSGALVTKMLGKRVLSENRRPYVREVALKKGKGRIFVSTAYYKNGFLLADLGAQEIVTRLREKHGSF